MSRPREEQDPRRLNIYESIATAIYGQQARQYLDEAQMEFLLSLLDGVYYQSLDEDFVQLLREGCEAGLAGENLAEWRELLMRTDLKDEESVKAHYRMIRHWLDEKAGRQV